MEFVDTEWLTAQNADEKEAYYYVYNYSGGRTVKKYKPSLAKLVAQRTGKKIILVRG